MRFTLRPRFERGTFNDLQVLREDHTAGGHVCRAGARGLHGVRNHEADDRDDRDDADDDATLQEEAVALFLLALRLTGLLRLLAG